MMPSSLLLSFSTFLSVLKPTTGRNLLLCPCASHNENEGECIAKITFTLSLVICVQVCTSLTCCKAWSHIGVYAAPQSLSTSCRCVCLPYHLPSPCLNPGAGLLPCIQTATTLLGLLFFPSKWNWGSVSDFFQTFTFQEQQYNSWANFTLWLVRC